MIKDLTLTFLAILLSIATFALTPIFGSHTVCTGASTSLTDSTSGGTWSSSNPAIATVGATTGTVNGISAGVATITYMVGTPFVTYSITVNPTPAPIIGSGHVAAGGTITLTDASPGGTWSTSCSNLSISATTGMVTGISPGICYYISYTMPSTGCAVSHVDTVTGTISAIGGTLHTCVGSTSYLSDTATGGTWSSSNTAIATVGVSSGIVTGIAAGTCTITYTVGTSYVTASFTVYAAPAAISGASTVAVGSTITLTDATGGGVWSSSTPGIATVSAGGVVTGVSVGTVTIYYTLTSGCAVYHTVTVTGGVLSPISGTLHTCVGSTSILSDTATGGTWSSSNTAIATVGATTGVVTGVSAGVCTITYTIGASHVTASFTVNPAPGSISGASAVAVGSTITLTDLTAGGVWSSSNTSIATVSIAGVVTGVSAGTVVITYTLTTGCYSVHTVSVTGSSILPISGTFSACIGSTSYLHDSTSGGTWSSSNTAIATVGATTGVVTGVSAGTCTITYTVGAFYVTHTFVVNPLPAVPSGPSTVAVGSTITLTDAGGGTWYSGNTSIATVGASTGIVTGVTAGTVWIYYELTTGCTNYKSVTVTGGSGILPITGTTHTCVGSTAYLMDSTAGGTWSSSNTAVATVGATTGVVTGIAAGTCTITYTVGASYVTTSFTVNAAPLAISGATTVAAGSSITLSDATSGGVWSSSNTSIATVSTAGVVTGVTSGTVTIYYTLTTGCSASHTVTVTGGGTLMPIIGTFHACVGSSSTLYDTVSGGTWSSSNTAIATVGATTGIVTGVSAGTCTITYTLGTSHVTAGFTVNPLPSAITGASTVTVGGTITLTDATPGGTWASGATYTATVGASTGIVTGVGSGVVNIYYTTASGCAVYHSVTVSGGMISPISGTLHTCVGSTSALGDTATGGTWSSSNPAVATINATTGVVTGVSAGTCTISYTVGGSTVTATFTVATPPAAIAGSSSVCVGSSITLTDATSGGVWSSGATYVATVVSTSGVVTGVSSGTAAIYYLLPSGCGVEKTITVHAVPAPISGSSTVCIGSTITLSDTTSGGTWSSVYTAYATVGATTGVVTGVLAGTTTIIYSIGGCTASKTVTVHAAPAAITGASSVCAGSSITLTDATPGGTWSSGMTATATVSTGGVVTGVAAGVVDIYYSLGGCSEYHAVTVNPVPTAISGSSTVHTSGAPITLTDGTAGGTWFSGNPSLASVGALTGVVTGVAAGTVNIFYSIGGCAVYKTVTVLSPAPPGFHGSTGTSTITNAEDIKLYPNPTSGNLNIQWDNQLAGNASVYVIDMVGREVFKSDIDINDASGNTQINLNSLKDGIYIISIKSESINYTARIMVQH